MLQMLHIQHLLAEHIVNPSLLITFFPYGQSTLLQCYSVALYKRLFRSSVHTGTVRNWSGPLRSYRFVHLLVAPDSGAKCFFKGKT